MKNKIKRFLAVLILGFAVAGCGTAVSDGTESPDTSHNASDCESQDGTVTQVGNQYSCIIDGQVVAQWQQ